MAAYKDKRQASEDKTVESQIRRRRRSNKNHVLGEYLRNLSWTDQVRLSQVERKRLFKKTKGGDRVGKTTTYNVKYKVVKRPLTRLKKNIVNYRQLLKKCRNRDSDENIPCGKFSNNIQAGNFSTLPVLLGTRLFSKRYRR